MKKFNFPIIGAVITALLSTLCCLPAFLFIFFGISGGVLTYFTTLEFVRIPMAIFTIILFIYGIYKMNKKISCASTKQELLKKYIVVISLFLLIVGILLYPELIPLFME